MWKLFNIIFGWDYIAWENTAASGIARVHKDHCGNIYYWRYKGTSVLDVIKQRQQVKWLTCSPEKYGL
jgi:hypothetical protein